MIDAYFDYKLAKKFVDEYGPCETCEEGMVEDLKEYIAQARQEGIEQGRREKEEEVHVFQQSAETWRAFYDELYQSERRPAGSYAMPMRDWKSLPAPLPSDEEEAENCINSLEDELFMVDKTDLSIIKERLVKYFARIRADQDRKSREDERERCKKLAHGNVTPSKNFSENSWIKGYAMGREDAAESIRGKEKS